MASALALPAHGQSLLEQVRAGVEQVAPVLIPPGAQVTIQIIQGKDPVRAVTDVAGKQARIIVSSGEAVAALDQGIENKIKEVVGKDIAKIIEIVRLPGKIEREGILQTIATVADGIDKRKVDLQRIGAIPLSTALQQAIDLYKGRAQPIPDTIKVLLATSFDAKVLNEVRFVIDDNLGSLPGTINFLKETITNAGNGNTNHAVTVGYIIVFAKDPGLRDVRFWSHEIQHAKQYAELGVAGFAAKYFTDFAQMEKEADDVAAAAEAEAKVISKFINVQTAAVSAK